jgi:hypothetical protein
MAVPARGAARVDREALHGHLIARGAAEADAQIADVGVAGERPLGDLGGADAGRRCRYGHSRDAGKGDAGYKDA